MAEAIKRSDPTAVIADLLLGKGTGALLPIRVEKKALVFGSGTGNGTLLSWQNPENVKIMATVLFYVSVAGTGTAGVDIGVGGNATASSDNLLDAALVNTVDLVRGSGSADLGSNGRFWRFMDAKDGSSDYIVGKANDVDATAAGDAYIVYIPVS